MELFYRKGIFKNLAKFKGKQLCWSLFYKIFARLRPTILLKKRLGHRCFPVSFTKFLKTPFYRILPSDWFFI